MRTAPGTGGKGLQQTLGGETRALPQKVPRLPASFTGLALHYHVALAITLLTARDFEAGKEEKGGQMRSHRIHTFTVREFFDVMRPTFVLGGGARFCQAFCVFFTRSFPFFCVRGAPLKSHQNATTLASSAWTLKNYLVFQAK